MVAIGHADAPRDATVWAVMCRLCIWYEDACVVFHSNLTPGDREDVSETLQTRLTSLSSPDPSKCTTAMVSQALEVDHLCQSVSHILSRYQRL